MRTGIALAGILLAFVACGPSNPPATGLHQVAAIAVGNNAGIPAFGFGSAWVPNSSDGTVSRIDLRTNLVTATIRVGDYAAFHAAGCDRYNSVHSYMVTAWSLRQCDQPTGIAAGTSAVWVTRNQTSSVAPIDPRTSQLGADIPLPFRPFQLATNAGELWVTSLFDTGVVVIDEASRQIVAVLRDLPQGSTGITFVGGSAWVVGSYSGAVTRIDAATHRVLASVNLPCARVCFAELRPLAITAAFGYVWIRNEGNGTLARVDPRTLAVTTFGVDSFWGRDGLDSIASYGGAVWVGGLRLQQVGSDGRVARRYPDTATVVSTGAGSLWFTRDDGRLVRADL